MNVVKNVLEVKDIMVKRIFAEKKEGFNIEAKALLEDLKYNLGISGLEGVRIINRYDIEGITDDEYEKAKYIVFSEPPVDKVYDEEIGISADEKVIAVEYLPGQYDQRADSAAQCIQLLTCGEMPDVRTAKIIVLKGKISEEEYNRIKSYCINPVECREAALEKPATLKIDIELPEEVETVKGFIEMSKEDIERYAKEMGFAMSADDLEFCRDYFRNEEKRDPTITELKVIDTYWSDHCRHTTFLTNIKNVEIEKGKYSDIIKEAYERYLESRKTVYEDKEKEKSVCLMDIATIAAKELRKSGKLDNLEVSDENNACSIVVNVDVDGKNEEWLVMFKNETHNHPTEIEPFGGAATCLGGAIRDPLSGRAYVYQAMRVTGSGDPRTKVEDTIPGKLPQRKITTGAAAGYSSYGNQIGLATGQVHEIYDEGFVAKRMEIGAVIGAAPRKNVIREKPVPGDVIILLGGRTGRDGCGGATGSSKEHDEKSILTCGSEVQKGNPPTERKIQRLFRKPEVSTMIKKCNDFGAGGVSVAIGELADGLKINLDLIPKKYEGLDGTELAISESQERMAVVVSPENADKFIQEARNENLEAVIVAVVTGDNRLEMTWRGKKIVDISRKFLNTNGVAQYSEVVVKAPAEENFYFSKLMPQVEEKLEKIEEAWVANLQQLNTCSQKGLVERFDSTIGAGTVLMPFGGKYQLTPSEGMAAKIPVQEGETNTGTLMTFGYNPLIGKWSPFHGAVYSIIESIAKIVALGGDYSKIRLTLQEYFEKLGQDPAKWGKPFSALLGAHYVQTRLGIPAIGGKDSMSGTFKDMNVPPTLVSFAVNTADVRDVVSGEFKKAGNSVVLVSLKINENGMPDFQQMEKNFKAVNKLIKSGIVLSAYSVKSGGIAEAISKMSFGNKIGFQFKDAFSKGANNTNNIRKLFEAAYGSIILEIDGRISKIEELKEIIGKGEVSKISATSEISEIKEISEISEIGENGWILLGETSSKQAISINGTDIDLDMLIEKWSQPLESIFPTKVHGKAGHDDCGKQNNTARENLTKNNSTEDNASKKIDARPRDFSFEKFISVKSGFKIPRPRVFMPVFPGTNCEYDTRRKFEKAGAIVDEFVLNNLSKDEIEASIKIMADKIKNSQIIMFPGGFSGGDEPDGSGKFISAVFRNPYIKDAVQDLLKNRDGLILGICNGFQALIKLGLVPYGEIRDIDENCPTLTFNTIGRHVSCMVRTKVVSTISPWLANVRVGDIHTIPVSHGEGRFVASREVIDALAKGGQIATQYVDMDGNPTYDIRYNPNGSVEAIEGITSPDGRVFGKMGHSERTGSLLAKNVPGDYDQKLFEAGVGYYR